MQVQIELLLEEWIGALKLGIASSSEDNVLPVANIPMQLEDLHGIEGLQREVRFEGLGYKGDAGSAERVFDQPIIIGGQQERTDTGSGQARQRLVQLHKGAGLCDVALQLQDEIGLAIARNKGIDQLKAGLVHPRELCAQELLKLAQRRVAGRSTGASPNP